MKDQIKQERGATYGDFSKNLELTAQFFELYKQAAGGKYSPAHDEAIHLMFNKISRIANGTFHKDNYVDGAVYLEQAGEERLK